MTAPMVSVENPSILARTPSSVPCSPLPILIMARPKKRGEDAARVFCMIVPCWTCYNNGCDYFLFSRPTQNHLCHDDAFAKTDDPVFSAISGGRDAQQHPARHACAARALAGRAG